MKLPIGTYLIFKEYDKMYKNILSFHDLKEHLVSIKKLLIESVLLKLFKIEVERKSGKKIIKKFFQKRYTHNIYINKIYERSH